MEPYRVGTDAGGQMNGDPQTAKVVSRLPYVIAAIAGASAILIGAFGAHGLQSYLPKTGVDSETIINRLAQFDTGARYHLAHAIVLLILSAIPLRHDRWFKICYGLFVAGILLFSGSLYLLVLTNTTILGAVTPIGGICWVIAWLMLMRPLRSVG